MATKFDNVCGGVRCWVVGGLFGVLMVLFDEKPKQRESQIPIQVFKQLGRSILGTKCTMALLWFWLGTSRQTFSLFGEDLLIGFFCIEIFEGQF